MNNIQNFNKRYLDIIRTNISLSAVSKTEELLVKVDQVHLASEFFISLCDFHHSKSTLKHYVFTYSAAECDTILYLFNVS